MLTAVSRLVSLVLAAVIGGVVVMWFAARGEAPAPLLPQAQDAAYFAPEELVAVVTQMPAAERIRLGGYVAARDAVQLTAQAPGRVTYIAGEEGDRVSMGQVVVALDDDAIQPQYRAAWAALSGEMAKSENAQTQLYQKLYGPRTSPLGGPAYDVYDRASVPLYNMAQSFMGQLMPGLGGGQGSPFGTSAPMLTQDQAQHDWAAANSVRAEYEGQLAALAGAQAQVDLLDAQLRDRQSVAPWSAAILKRHVRVGDPVQPGQPLMDLADVDRLDVLIEVPLAQLSALRLGDQVPVTVANVNLWAPVTQIFPAADDHQRTVSVKLTLPDGAPAAPGMYALAWIAQPGGGSPSALAPAIPATAITRRGSLPVAFVVDGRGRVEMRVLRLGDTQGTSTAVLSGLEPGETVIADPSPTLKSGDSVTGRRP